MPKNSILRLARPFVLSLHSPGMRVRGVSSGPLRSLDDPEMLMY